MNIRKWSVLIFMFYNFINCVDQNIIRIDKDILNGWDIRESIRIDIMDTVNYPSNIYFHVRNNNDYPFSNIFLL